MTSAEIMYIVVHFDRLACATAFAQIRGDWWTSTAVEKILYNFGIPLFASWVKFRVKSHSAE